MNESLLNGRLPKLRSGWVGVLVIIALYLPGSLNAQSNAARGRHALSRTMSGLTLGMKLTDALKAKPGLLLQEGLGNDELQIYGEQYAADTLVRGVYTVFYRGKLLGVWTVLADSQRAAREIDKGRAHLVRYHGQPKDDWFPGHGNSKRKAEWDDKRTARTFYLLLPGSKPQGQGGNVWALVDLASYEKLPEGTLELLRALWWVR